MEKDNHTRKTATIGGTFDVLHTGHKDYIRLAFQYADHVLIYVNSDEYVRPQKCYAVQPFAARVNQLKKFLRSRGIHKSAYEIRKLNALEELQQDYQKEDIQLAVIVPEYYPLLHGLNQLRMQAGKNPILILVKERTRDENNSDISSSAIRRILREQLPQLSNGKMQVPEPDVMLR